MIHVLDNGYLKLIECWGSDQRIIEAARMSTDKGFLGWGPKGVRCPRTGCGWEGESRAELVYVDSDRKWAGCPRCQETDIRDIPGDEKLLKFLWENAHATPFEFAGMVIEVQAPIFVFREWHRHRTQCLGPDTLVHFDAPKSRNNRRFVYKLRIEDVWRKWQPAKRSARPERQTNALWPRERIQAMQLRNLDEEQREFGHSRIVDVIRGEPKEMVRVTTASGRSVVATRAHRVLTCVGWMTLGDAIDQGALLTLEGTTRGKAMRWERPEADESQETWTPVRGWHGLYEVSDQGRVRRVGCQPKRPTPGANDYDVVSLSRSGETSVRTVHSLVLESFVGAAPSGHEARHRNDNRADARLSNLVWGTPQQNADDRVRSDRQQRLVSVFEEIVVVDSVGLQPTFDLAVEGPWHNFVADGFVVHNSYNEMSARYTPLPALDYRPTAERCLVVGGANKQAGTIKGADELTHESVLEWLEELDGAYVHAERVYQSGLKRGIPKEIARLPVPVARYSRMRASTCLRNWLAFLTLRQAPNAQWEIRQYANAVRGLLADAFPKTMELF
jgi:thymidylate synthase (FAD)